MTKVLFTTVTEVTMDEFNQEDIIEMGTSISIGGKKDIEGICQSANVLSIKAQPVLDEIDCMVEKDEIPAV